METVKPGDDEVKSAARLFQDAQENLKLAKEERSGRKVTYYARALQCAVMSVKALLDQIDETTTNEQKIAIHSEAFAHCLEFLPVVDTLNDAGLHYMIDHEPITIDLLSADISDEEADGYILASARNRWLCCKESSAGLLLKNELSRVCEALVRLYSESGNYEGGTAVYKQAAEAYRRIFDREEFDYYNRKAEHYSVKPQIETLEKEIGDLRARLGVVTSDQEQLTVWTQIRECYDKITSLLGYTFVVEHYTYHDRYYVKALKSNHANPAQYLESVREADEEKERLKDCVERAEGERNLSVRFSQCQAESDLNKRLLLLRELHSDADRLYARYDSDLAHRMVREISRAQSAVRRQLPRTL